MWLLAGLLLPRRLIRLNCCLPLATSDSALLSPPTTVTFLFFGENKAAGRFLAANVWAVFSCPDVRSLTLKDRRGVISSMECFAVAAGMPRRFQAFPRPDPASEHAMSESAFKCFQKCGKNSSAVSPAPGPPFLKGLDFRGLTTTFLLSRPLITRTLPREVDWSFLDQNLFFTALFLQPLPGDFLFVKVTSPLFFSFPWAAPSASTNSCANTTASCSTISWVRALGKHVEYKSMWYMFFPCLFQCHMSVSFGTGSVMSRVDFWQRTSWGTNR